MSQITETNAVHASLSLACALDGVEEQSMAVKKAGWEGTTGTFDSS